MSSADNLCKQFGGRSLKEFFEKKLADDNNSINNYPACKDTRLQYVPFLWLPAKCAFCDLIWIFFFFYFYFFKNFRSEHWDLFVIRVAILSWAPAIYFLFVFAGTKLGNHQTGKGIFLFPLWYPEMLLCIKIVPFRWMSKWRFSGVEIWG